MTGAKPKFKVAGSTIHGMGAIAIVRIEAGDRIDTGVPGFPGFNHSCADNVGHNLIAKRTIEVGEELTVNYGRHRTHKGWMVSGLGIGCRCELCRPEPMTGAKSRNIDGCSV